MNVEFWKENYNNLDRPDLWEGTADTLSCAAEILYLEWHNAVREAAGLAVGTQLDSELYSKMRFGSIWMMLNGLSIECLLKALYFKYNENNIVDGKLNVTWPGSGHMLYELLQMVNTSIPADQRIDLDDNEIGLLKRLTEFIEWAGKYPIPKRWEKIKPQKIDRGIMPATAIRLPNDRVTCMTLVAKLKQMVD